jgi:hypothetical protein
MAFFCQTQLSLSPSATTPYTIFATLKIALNDTFFCTNKPIFHMKSDKIKSDIFVGAGFKPALARIGSTVASKRAGLKPAPTRLPKIGKKF